MYKFISAGLALLLAVVSLLYLREKDNNAYYDQLMRRNQIIAHMESYLGQPKELLVTHYPNVQCGKAHCMLDTEQLYRGDYFRAQRYQLGELNGIGFDGVEVMLSEDDTIIGVSLIGS